jgi:hypothetical protein
MIEYAWTAAIATAPHVYMGRPYQDMLAANDGSEARVVQCSGRGAAAYLPILVKDLGAGNKEAYSAYGYGGLCGALQLSEADVAALQAFLSRDSIAALFLRHSPFLGNALRWPASRVQLNRRTYAARLRSSPDFDAYLAHVPQKLRWSANFARRAGLTVAFHSLDTCARERICSFYRLYAGLMRHKQTSDYYLFSEQFFLEHARCLGASCELAEILHPQTGELLAAAFFLLDEDGWAHYHLSATWGEASKLQAAELLMLSALFRYGNLGYRALHLGGGHTLDESDGLSRFKSKFAGERLDFQCTKLVCDEAAYARERVRMPLRNPALFLVSDARGM